MLNCSSLVYIRNGRGYFQIFLNSIEISHARGEIFRLYIERYILCEGKSDLASSKILLFSDFVTVNSHGHSELSSLLWFLSRVKFIPFIPKRNNMLKIDTEICLSAIFFAP